MREILNGLKMKTKRFDANRRVSFKLSFDVEFNQFGGE
jgi:hypothetical protein